MNFLEELAAEWYGYQNYFILRNVKFGKRAGGGYEGEMDIVAFDPQTQILRHIEISGDADSWPQRIAKFKKKFQAATRHYRSTFDFEFKKVEKIAIVGYTHPKKQLDFGSDISFLLIPEFIKTISSDLRDINPLRKTISEVYPLLRAIQFAVYFGKSTTKIRIINGF
jgi:hypothetical protein